MTFVKPQYSKGEVTKAGKILSLEHIDLDKFSWAFRVLANWRAAHTYPINTFQATLRKKLSRIEKRFIVATRLKRTPSIVDKLIRIPKMQLARMQDIGGLRAITKSITNVRLLEKAYLDVRFSHSLVGRKDYIESPKPDGYRGIHLIFRYNNAKAPDYNGLHIELQIRTLLQHAWATAVETMGTFLGQAIKSGMGEEKWRYFFALTAAGIAHMEKSPPVPGFEQYSAMQIYCMVSKAEKELGVLHRLRSFTVATSNITEKKGTGSYHLVILNSQEKTVSIHPYSSKNLEQANTHYAEVEKRSKKGEHIEAVLVSAGPIKALKKAYPNYFLDTNAFIKQVRLMIELAERLPLLALIA